MSRSELKIVSHTFISSRLDYCNSLFACLNKASFEHQQVVQNTAASLLAEFCKYSHVTSLLI